MKKIMILMVTGTLGFLFSTAQAAYPDREITLVCAHAAGTNTDQCIRSVSDIVSKALGQPIVVVNKPGASYVIGASFVANAKPDGYTIGATSGSAFTQLPHMRNVPFDIFKDFTWIASFTQHTVGLVVKADSPWKTFQEFLDDAKKNPGKMIYSHDGYGLGGHILPEWVALTKGGIDWKFVPIPGGPKQATALLGGHTHAWSAGGFHVQFVKDKAMRLLVNYDTIRLKASPDVPTLRELGFDPGTNDTPIVIMGPKGLPDHIRKKLEDTYLRAMQDPSYMKLLDTMNMPTIFKGSKELAETIPADFKAWGRLVKITGVKTEKGEK